MTADSKPKASEANHSGVQVISRAAMILRSLKNEQEGLSLGQIAERVGLPRSTVQRIVGALQAEHFVIAASPDRGIRLGPQISALAESAHINIGEFLRPYLVELARATGETVDLATLRGRRLIFIDQVPGTHRLRTVSSVGESFPLFNTANGKACLAAMSRSRMLAILAAERPELADDSQAVARIEVELAEVRASRLAYDRDEHSEGVSAVGAAFADLRGELYAISLPTPSGRFRRSADKIAHELRATMAQIEKLEIVGTLPSDAE